MMAKSVGKLTRQQQAVLCLLVKGLDLDAIANRLGIQRLTAEFHFLSLTQRLGISTQKALIEYAKANGLCE
jgi:DNA-binding NarL/FixJ family response regulator